jgi:hypothetical protein
VIVKDQSNNGRQAGKKHIPDESFPYGLLQPRNSHGTSPDRHFAGQRTQQNRGSSNGQTRQIKAGSGSCFGSAKPDLKEAGPERSWV